MVALILPVVYGGISSAETATTSASRLPREIEETSAIWTGEVAYLFGGLNDTRLDYYDDIVRYDPATGAVDVMPTQLPSPRAKTASVWDPRDRPEQGCPSGCAYIFGGSPFGKTDILQYNPSTETLTNLTSRLPGPRTAAAAFWSGDAAYIVGGLDPTPFESIDEIVRFDPVTGAVAVVAHMPTGRHDTTAVLVGGKAYIMGGMEYYVDHSVPKWGFRYSDSILSFDPSTNTVAVEATILEVSDGSAIWDGHNLFFFGGSSPINPFVPRNWVLRYNPVTSDITAMRATLPTGRVATSAVWTGTEAIIFGGFKGPALHEIVHYRLNPGPPQHVSVHLGPGVAEVMVSWAPPSPRTYSFLTGYEIFRTPIQGGTSELLASVPAGTEAWIDSTLTPFAFSYEVRGINDARDDGELARSDVLTTLVKDGGIT